jgi:predicted NBD/HSP70 family sugar kinase
MKSNTQLRQESLKKVISVIREKGPISKRELQRITGFSWGNISSTITLLCEEGIISCSGKQETGLGRRPEEFDINTENNYIIGVDFNRAYVMATVCDLRGRIVKSFKNDFQKDELKKQNALDNLYKTVSAAIGFCEGKTLAYIAVAMQGDVDYVNGISVSLSVIDDWENVPVCDLLKDKFGVDTVMFHDPDCVLYAERFFGVLGDANIKNAVEIIFTHGMGMGALLEGRIYRGNKGKSCEIKDVVVPFDKEDGYNRLLHVMGNRDTFVSSYFAKTGVSLSVKELTDLARSGEATALSVFTEAVKSLAFALVNVYYLFNPDKIVLFGSFKDYSDLIVSCLEELVKEICYNDFEAVIELSALDDNATAVGAALFAADIYIKDLYFE